MWVLAVTVMILVAVRQTMSDCGATEEDSGHQGALTRLASGVLTLPVGGRVLVVAVAAAVWGPRSALLGLLVWGIIVVGYAIGGYGPDVPASVDSTAVAGNSPGRASPVAGQGEPTGLAALLNLATPVPTELAAPAGPAGLAEYGGSKDVMTWSQPALMSNVRLLPGPESQQGELAPRNVTAPLDLAQPAGRAQPADLAQPVSSAQLADLAQPVSSAQLADLAQSVDLTQRVSPAGALELLQPAELTGPLEVTGSLELTGPLDLGGLATASGPGPRLLATITACRDDGTFARYLGRLLRGNLIPLPPAIAGLAAASMLAVLGLRNLPGIIVLTPLVVMLLAAPGSSHPHDGRFDWLVPAVLQAGQYVYIATLGFASGVAPLAIFALCAMTTIRYADLAYRGRNAQAAATALASAGRRARKIDIGMGWEGRMLAAGLGVIIGVGTFAYLALTAYLGVLICSEVMTSRLAAGEDNRP